MSGHKRTTVNLNQEDYHRLHEADMLLRSVQKDYQDVKEKIKKLRMDSLWASFDKMEDRQNLFNESLQGMDEQLLAIEMKTSQDMTRQISTMNSRIEDMGDNLWENTVGLLEEQSRVIQSSIIENEAIRQAQFSRLQNALYKFKHNQESKVQIAFQAIHAASMFLDSITNLYNPDQFFPGELDRLKANLDQTRQNLEIGFFEAALLGAQQVYNEAVQLRWNIEETIHNQEMVCAALLEKGSQLYEFLKQYRTVPALDMEGKELELLIDMNYWSQGRWNELGRNCRSVLSLLHQDADQMDTELLNKLSQKLDDIEQISTEAIYQARLNVLSSQLRFNIAECVVQALHEQGYELVAGNYKAEDMRNPYQTIMKDLAGSEIVVTISPSPEQIIAQTLDMVSFDAEPRSEHELVQRAAELSSALQQYGLEVGKMCAMPNNYYELNSDQVNAYSIHETEKKSNYGYR